MNKFCFVLFCFLNTIASKIYILAINYERKPTTFSILPHQNLFWKLDLYYKRQLNSQLYYLKAVYDLIFYLTEGKCLMLERKLSINDIIICCFIFGLCINLETQIRFHIESISLAECFKKKHFCSHIFICSVQLLLLYKMWAVEQIKKYDESVKGALGVSQISKKSEHITKNKDQRTQNTER